MCNLEAEGRVKIRVEIGIKQGRNSVRMEV